MAMKSTEKTAVQEIAPGVYRVVEVGGRSAVSGRFVTAAQAARHPRSTISEATGSTGRRTATRSVASGRFVTKTTGAKNPK